MQKSRICVSVAREDLDAMYLDTQKAFKEGADLVELRLDYMELLDLEEVKKKFKTLEDKTILTLRKKEEGGRFQGSETKRVALLKQLQGWRAAYKDVELSTLKDSKIKVDANTIVSWHDFASTPSAKVMKAKLAATLEYGGMAKIVTTAKKLSDNLAVLDLYSKEMTGRLIAFCMGEEGKISRILAPMLGSPLMYGCLEGAAVAPGQIPISELRGFYELFEVA
ncbi:MAG: type I 3-dehydroquinate dehydratase [Thaumarchaeota archaeon]|nr:type I 3-dehydroquinate dehydratase [Nitrososphaerota archaeon]